MYLLLRLYVLLSLRRGVCMECFERGEWVSWPAFMWSPGSTPNLMHVSKHIRGFDNGQRNTQTGTVHTIHHYIHRDTTRTQREC